MDKIDIEELEKLADEMGYKLTKKPEPLPKFLPCGKCGSKRRYLAKMYSKGGYSVKKRYVCRVCKLEAEPGKNEYERRVNWNAACLAELDLGGKKDEYCENCRYYRIDEDANEGFCKQTYSETYSESSCDSF